MCGIVTAIARRNIVPVLLEGLRKLEYRGYDSAGLAVLKTDGVPALQRLRAVGRVAELAAQADATGLAAGIGIAHTRWATHGVPSERNAHPHISSGLAVVHNGIIENFEELRGKLQAKGYAFTSETDTEAIAHLLHDKLKTIPDLFDAVRATLAELIGAYAIGVVCEADPTRAIVARKGSPLLLGIGEDGHYAASDTAALLQVTRKVVYLEDGDVAELTLDGYRVTLSDGTPVERAVNISSLSADAVELGKYRHYMQKEIFEQPQALGNTLEMIAGGGGISPQLFGADAVGVFGASRRVLILACGTSYHAGLVARYWIEAVAKLPCTVEIASEYRYRESVPDPETLVVVISQSGVGVYRLTADGVVTALVRDMTRPNGIAFSPDEKTLYVAQSDPAKALWMAFPVNSDGTLGKGRVFADVTAVVDKAPGLPDGMKVDRMGNLWATGPGGIYVFTPEGRLLGRIDTGQRTANCNWGDDGSTLYITADSYLCRIRTTTRGW